MNMKAMLITAWIWFPALATAYKTESGTSRVCNSSECIQRAKLLNESMNTSIDPCTDFYSHVCGRWESNHPLVGGRKSYDVYQETCKDTSERLSYILGKRTLVESKQTIIDKVSAMYNACLALPDASDALIRVLNESGLNSWPILTEGNIFNFSNCTSLLRHMNISAIAHVELSKTAPSRVANPYEIYIMTMPVQKQIMKVSNIATVISNTIKSLNLGIDSSIQGNLTKQLVEFAKNLSAITIDGHSVRYNMSSLQAMFTNIPISDLLEKEFGKVNITLTGTDTFNVYYTYYKELNELLATANPNTLYNYAGFLAMFPYTPYVNMSTEEAISNDLTHSKTPGRNSSECIALLDESVRDILDYLYVINEPDHTVIKDEVEHIAKRLKQTFNETLQHNSWIDNATREALEKKLKEVPVGIGYPDALLNMSILETGYQYVPFFPSDISFVEALYHIHQNSYKMRLRKSRYPEEGDWGWDRSPRHCGRSFHDKFGTKIEIPYAIFLSPFFQQGLPSSLNYGGIGGTIARELAYAFSINAIQNCRPSKCRWPNKEKLVALLEDRASCFKKQYKKVNEKLLELSHEMWFWQQTSDKDLVDNTGLQTAFNAYNKVLQEECDRQDTRLPGLESFSGTQLFLISNARTMCQIADRDTRILDIWGGYSPAENRVNEAMKNFEGFAEAFNCSRDSPMNPVKNCTLW